MDDFRILWFKDIIYKTLAIDPSDSAFEYLLEKHVFVKECLQNLIIGSNKEKTCIFFYCTVEEEEIEVEDMCEIAEESEKIEGSVSSASEKSESENASIVDKTEDKSLDNVDDAVGNVMLKIESPDDTGNASEIYESKRLPKKSTTSLLQIIKKNVLHFSENVTKYVSSQKYVYFLQSKLEPIELVKSMENAYDVMTDYFEVGCISQHPLVTMNKVISHLYLPILENENWISTVFPNKCKMANNELSTQFKEFHKEIRDFLKSSEETVRQIEKPFMFLAPSIITGCTSEELAQERSFVIEAEELINEWTITITNLLEQTVQKKPPENDLLGEINFWKSQKFTLSTCYDHLNQSSIQQTINILKIANSDINDFQLKIQEVEEHMEIAFDNFSYLSLLEPVAKNMLPEKSFEDTQKSIQDIFMLLKLIWIQSNYYNDTPNMCRLIKGVSTLLKENVKQNANVENLFREPLHKVHKIVLNSSQLLIFWKEQYLKESENVKTYGGSYWWGFDIRAVFTETDHMIQVCYDLENVALMLEELYNIFNTNLKYFVQDVKGLDILEVRVFGITSRIQYADFDIFDPKYQREWENIMKTFIRDIKNFEDEIKAFISKMLCSLSWENAYVLTNSFRNISVSSSIQDFINKSYDDMLNQFIKEIYDKENEFLTYKNEPPHFEGIPKTMSSILWAQDLLKKLSQPISQIYEHGHLYKRELEVQERFKKTELLLKEYRLEKYEIWKISAVEILNKFLQQKILKEFQSVATNEERRNSENFQKILKYQVNFPIYLEEISIEAKLLEYYGFEIPSFVKNIILQEKLYYEYRHDLRITLVNLKRSITKLTENEISILDIPIENLCIVLDQGVNNILWESSEIMQFVKNAKKAINAFRSLVSQINIVFLEIDGQIKSLMNCDLFHFHLCDDTQIPTCEEFFEDAESKMDKEIENIVTLHSTFPLMLKHLEKLTCKTATGKANQMKHYYHRCEEKILKSLLKMLLSNFEYFKGEILEKFIFTYFKTASQSNNELVLSSLIRAELIFVTFIRNTIESMRKMIRWMDGTCIPTPKFFVEETKEQMEFSYYLDICLHPEVKKLILNIIDTFSLFIKNNNNGQ